MSGSEPMTVLCLASHEKGAEFMRECKRQGCRVFLLTREDKAQEPWPRESLEDVFYMPTLTNQTHIINGVSYLSRANKINRIIALDDLDVEMAAALREHLRVPGMGDTTARYFRDKLAMRMKARESGILVPDFIHVLNYDALREWMARVPAPWVLKPRSEASSVGIRKIHNSEELWRALDHLGDRQSYYVLEQYIRGTVFHVDGIVWERELQFAEVHRYARPPLDITQSGGVFSSSTVRRGAEEEQQLEALQVKVIRALGLVRGATHTEFIQGDEDGRFYFLETSARVGGANIPEMIEAATGINLWREWARLEVANFRKEEFHLSPARAGYAGIIISLAQQEWPDTSAYQEPEIRWRLNKRHHAGLVVAAPTPERVQELLNEYMHRFARDFLATMPPPETLRDG